MSHISKRVPIPHQFPEEESYGSEYLVSCRNKRRRYITKFNKAINTVTELITQNSDSDEINKSNDLLEVIINKIRKSDDLLEVIINKIRKSDDLLEEIINKIRKTNDLLEVIINKIRKSNDFLEVIVNKIRKLISEILKYELNDKIKDQDLNVCTNLEFKLIQLQNSIESYINMKIKPGKSSSSRSHNLNPHAKSRPVSEPLHHSVTKICKAASHADTQKGSNLSSSSKKSSKFSLKSSLTKSSKESLNMSDLTRHIYHSKDLKLPNLISY